MRDGTRWLLSLSLSLSTHFAHVLYVLQLAELRQSVVSKSFVKRSVSVLVGDVQVGAFANEKLQNKTSASYFLFLPLLQSIIHTVTLLLLLLLLMYINTNPVVVI